MTLNEKIIKNKLGLLNLSEERGNVSRACREMGFSRYTFYRYRSAMENVDIEALIDRNRRKPNIKNRVDEQIESSVVSIALENPASGQVRVSNELRKNGIFILPGVIRSIFLRNNLHTFNLRLNALENKVANDGVILTEKQVAALEKKKEEDVAYGEIETAYPGYLGSQDTFYVGTIKGVGQYIPADFC